MNIKLTKKESKEINLKINTKHLTFEERIKNFEKLPVDDKGTIEKYDCGEDLGLENLKNNMIGSDNNDIYNW